ncbi:MAG: flagellin N-terminal helical domain-containing protein [Gemmatimonadaceae bacterium]
MRINTNVAALNAYRNLSDTNSAVSSSMQKLSSGFRINRAADDAAGLGIANKLRGDIRAMSQASRNTEQANSVLQIAEGATSSIQQMLERMKELATQAGSDSVDASGRGRINSEFTALRSEITRTVATTKFQGAALLDGTFGDAGASLATGDITSLSSSAAGGTYSLAVDSSTGALTVTGPGTFSQTVALSAATYDSSAGKLSFAVTGLGTIAVAADSATDVANVVAGLDGRGFGVTAGAAGSTAAAGTATGAATATSGDYSSATKSFDISVDGATATTITLDGNYADLGAMITDINAKLATATIDVSVADDGSGKLVWTQGTAEAADFVVTDTDSVLGGAVTFSGTDTVTAVSPTITADSVTGNPTGEQASFLVGVSGAYGTDDLIKLDAINLSVASLGIDTADLSTASSARTALATLDTAMDSVSKTLGDIGASQNRIGYAMSNLKTSIQNFSAAESVIRDLDMAEEMTKFSKNNILAQAGTAMLAQANQSAQGVLQLLRG